MQTAQVKPCKKWRSRPKARGKRKPKKLANWQLVEQSGCRVKVKVGATELRFLIQVTFKNARVAKKFMRRFREKCTDDQKTVGNIAQMVQSLGCTVFSISELGSLKAVK